jgi:hypothetical protein
MDEIEHYSKTLRIRISFFYMVQNRPPKPRGWLKYLKSLENPLISQKCLEGTKTVTAIDWFLKFSGGGQSYNLSYPKISSQEGFIWRPKFYKPQIPYYRYIEISVAIFIAYKKRKNVYIDAYSTYTFKRTPRTFL